MIISAEKQQKAQIAAIASTAESTNQAIAGTLIIWISICYKIFSEFFFSSKFSVGYPLTFCKRMGQEL